MAGAELVDVTARKPLVWLAIAASVLLIAALLVKPVSREYLKSHHSTMLSSLITLLVPPADLYTSVVKKSIQYGRVEKIGIKHTYAGRYMVTGRLASAPGEKIEGHLNCGAFSLPLRNEGEMFDRDGRATDLGYYAVNGDLVGRALECEILLTRGGRKGVETIEVARLSDL